MNKIIDIVIPVYNEDQSIEKTLNDLIGGTLKFKKYLFNFIVIDDGSTDSTLNILKEFCAKNNNVKFISFSRNFGKEAATSAGIMNSTGSALIMADGDGQHPVETISEFIKHWEMGFEVVVGVRISNKGEGYLKKYGSKLFYKILNVLNGDKAVPGTTDFRLIDRKVIIEFNKLTERGRITRGLIDWMGFKRAYIHFEANERAGGKASYSFSKLFSLALHAFISHSTAPLKAVGLLGVIITFLAGFLGLFIVVEMYILGDPMLLSITGTAILAVFLSFLVGVVLACQGLLALYVESIFKESQNRPLYIISDQSK